MPMTTHNPSSAESLAADVGFDLLGEMLGGDVENAVSAALEAGTVFLGGGDALAIFRNTLAASIRDIEGEDKRGQLFQRFLRDGPYEHEGPIPPELQGKRLTPEECATVITFVFSFMASYNTYGFGYALGMNFRNPKGRREMLWPKDLDEIALFGRTANGCRIVERLT
jgi:hypothetical protein